jgi:hypothetical protein
MKTTEETRELAASREQEPAATGKKRWQSPEITSITSVLDTQSTGGLAGDGINNAS